MNDITVHTGSSMVIIRRTFDEQTYAEFPMTYAEANQLQADIRQVLTENAITMRDAF
jgi:hypothetical protein